VAVMHAKIYINVAAVLTIHLSVKRTLFTLCGVWC